jgi:hypothetical protein
LSESAQLHQSLDVALEVGGLDETRLARKNKDLDLSIQGLPVQDKVLERSKVMLAPWGLELARLVGKGREEAYLVRSMNMLANLSETEGSMPGARANS